MTSNHLILCRSLLLLPSIVPSSRVFSNESDLPIRWPKYWNFSFKISPPNEYSGLISFRIDWFHLLAAQRTLKSLLQHHSLKATILWCSAFFTVQLSHSCMTNGKTTTLTILTFVIEWMKCKAGEWGQLSGRAPLVSLTSCTYIITSICPLEAFKPQTEINHMEHCHHRIAESRSHGLAWKGRDPG